MMCIFTGRHCREDRCAFFVDGACAAAKPGQALTETAGKYCPVARWKKCDTICCLYIGGACIICE